MPLLDHFHPPLSQRRHWESFHSAWATALADHLNEKWLPEGYFAEEMITIGGRVEIEAATWDESSAPSQRTATLTRKTWSPPVPTQTVRAVFPDSITVEIYRSEGGPTLVAAIELVSPANKDRPAHRRAFAMKCGTYFQRGIGLAVVDIVTSRHANLHNELVALLEYDASRCMPDNAITYAVAYRPLRRDERDEIDIWQHPLTLGHELPTLPLALTGIDVVPLDLEATYQSVCQRRLID